MDKQCFENIFLDAKLEKLLLQTRILKVVLDKNLIDALK